MPGTWLCHSCRSIPFVHYFEEAKSNPGWCKSPFYGFHSTRATLEASSLHCQLCSLVLVELETQEKRPAALPESLIATRAANMREFEDSLGEDPDRHQIELSVAYTEEHCPRTDVFFRDAINGRYSAQFRVHTSSFETTHMINPNPVSNATARRVTS